jgi:antagonist of KipI
MKLFRIVKPGFFTTVQDLGRFGFLKFGVPISGAMDELSLQIANMLVSNDPGAACLEITLIGPELEALHDVQIAVAGDISLQINGQNSDAWQTINMIAGDVISLGKARTGCRAYFAVRGGIDVPVVLGSRSTHFRGEIGGFQGRQIKAEDYVEGFDAAQPIDHRLVLPQELIPSFSHEVDVSVVLGPQLESFTEKGLETLLSNPYVVTVEADRMGYRLEGPTIEHSEHVDTISEAIVPGSVQIPASGKPIVTMQDAQTTGGYPKIAVVMSADLHILGQAKPYDKIRFHETDLSTAHRKLQDYKKKIGIMESTLRRL